MIIGICGAKSAGKNTLCNAIRSLDSAYVELSFAAPLKAICMRVYGLTDAQCNDPVAKESPLAAPIALDDGLQALRELVGPCVAAHGFVARKPRQVLQLIGTEYARRAYPSYWLDALSAELASTPKAVITDCRFLNEAERIRSHGGKVVRVVRPDLESTDTHVSERELRDITVDYEVVNRLDDRLMRAAAELLETL